MTRRGDRGSVAPFIAVVSLALVMVAGMAYDGGQIVASQARARDLAGNAARAGAQEIDLAALRATGRPELIPDRASMAAAAYLEDVGATGDVRVDADTITVTVRLRQPMRILPLPDREVTASQSATAVASLTGQDSP